MQTSTVDLIFLLAALVAVFGIYKYHQAEKSDYAQTLDAIKDLKADHESLKKIAEKDIKKHDVDIKTLDTQIKDLQKQIDQTQEHIAKLRGSYMKLRDRIITQPRKVQIQGAIPIEVMGPSAPTQPHKQQIKQIKKQIESLSK